MDIEGASSSASSSSATDRIGHSSQTHDSTQSAGSSSPLEKVSSSPSSPAAKLSPSSSPGHIADPKSAPQTGFHTQLSTSRSGDPAPPLKDPGNNTMVPRVRTDGINSRTDQHVKNDSSLPIRGEAGEKQTHCTAAAMGEVKGDRTTGETAQSIGMDQNNPNFKKSFLSSANQEFPTRSNQSPAGSKMQSHLKDTFDKPSGIPGVNPGKEGSAVSLKTIKGEGAGQNALTGLQSAEGGTRSILSYTGKTEDGTPYGHAVTADTASKSPGDTESKSNTSLYDPQMGKPVTEGSAGHKLLKDADKTDVISVRPVAQRHYDSQGGFQGVQGRPKDPSGDGPKTDLPQANNPLYQAHIGHGFDDDSDSD